MINKRIYLIRHGQTDYNIKGIVQGRRIDSSLNEEGILQRDLLCEVLNKIPIKKIYITSLKRTFQTVQPLILNGIPYEVEPDLDELNFGIIEGEPICDSFGKSILTEVMTLWQRGDFDARFPEGESPNEALQRVKKGIAKILTFAEETPVVICLHQRILRIVMCYLLKKSLTEMDNYPHHNTGITAVAYNSELENFEILDFDNTQHLPQKNH